MTTMAVRHLFDSRGNWIAFRKGKYVYDSDGHWIGWLPWKDDVVVDRDGAYLGTIVKKKRLYRLAASPYRGYPGYAGYDSPPLGAEDVNLSGVQRS